MSENKMKNKSPIVTCATCGLNYEISLIGDDRMYNNKYYCDIHWEDAVRHDEIPIMCKRCDSVVSASFLRIYQGDRICPHCYAIQQHNDIINASKNYQNKMSSVKKSPAESIDKLSPIKTRRLTNKNWMNVAYK